MKRTCQRHGCSKTVTGRADRKYCSHTCQQLENSRRSYERKKGITLNQAMTQPMPLWKQHYILDNCKKLSLEDISEHIKKPVPAIEKFCREMGVKFFHAEVPEPWRRTVLTVRNEPPKKFERPPAVYTNQHPPYRYENYKERYL